MPDNGRYIFFMPAGRIQEPTIDYIKSNRCKIILCDGDENAFR